MCQDVPQVSSNPHPLMSPPASVFLSIGVGYQLTFCTNNGTTHLSNCLSFLSQFCKAEVLIISASAFDASASSELDFNPHGGKWRQRQVVVLKTIDIPNRRPFRVLALWWVCAVTVSFTNDNMHSSGRRREDGPEGACSPLFLLCFVYVCVGENGKQWLS